MLATSNNVWVVTQSVEQFITFCCFWCDHVGLKEYNLKLKAKRSCNNTVDSLLN